MKHGPVDSMPGRQPGTVLLWLCLVGFCAGILGWAHPARGQITVSGRSVPTTVSYKIGAGSNEAEFYSGNYAFVVVAKNYHLANDPQAFPDLDGVDKEAADLTRTLTAQGFEVHTLADPSSKDPARNLAAQLRNFLTVYAKPGRRVLVYLMGHGFTQGDLGYFAQVDALNNNLAPQEAARGSVSSTDLIAILRASKATHTFIVVDACYSGALFTERSAGSAFMPSAVRRTPTQEMIDDIQADVSQFLTAGRDQEQVPNPSAFTPAFILGINGYADLDNDGIVRGLELAEWLRSVVWRSQTRTSPRAGYIPAEARRLIISGGDNLFVYTAQQKAQVLGDMRSGGIALLPADLTATPPAAAWTFPKIVVKYFKKDADGGVVETALHAGGVPYLASKPQLSNAFAVNGLACHPDAPAEAVRAAATALINGGVRLRVIDRFENNVAAKRGTMEVLTFMRVRDDARFADLSLADVQAIEGCPTNLVKRITR